ncbi:ABC transporter permease [Actinomyces sp. 2119]|uniref:ABC transporter permease n=1 Tax=Actinomyces sp. 2119 TaxID=2321393 RepID=UPI000E6C0A83|nr:ABC transporter permease [Actinomyces sp. 2119]RJF40686.1 ABC transporter permease [Actinomyces sp. 2119]
MTTPTTSSTPPGPTASSTQSAPPDARLARTGLRVGDRSLGEFLMAQRAFIALIVLVVVFASLSSSFLDPTNLVSMTKHVAYNALLALGMLLVILTGGIDLSVGSVVGLTGVVAGVMLRGTHLSLLDLNAYPSVLVVVIVALLVGTGVGALNGLLVTRFRVAPFIATLGSLYMARGAALLISGGETYSDLDGAEGLGNTGFYVLGVSRFLGLPTSVWLMIVLGALVALLVARAPFGRWLYAVGGNERAAELSGVPVNRVKMRVYMASGFFAALAGLIIASELTAAAPAAGETYEMNAIAAVVIGGASLAGGRGDVKGALIGAFVIGFLNDGLVLVGVSSFWQTFLKGLVIVLAVVLDQGQQRLERSRAAAQAARSVRLEVERTSPGGEASAGAQAGPPDEAGEGGTSARRPQAQTQTQTRTQIQTQTQTRTEAAASRSASVPTATDESEDPQ